MSLTNGLKVTVSQIASSGACLLEELAAEIALAEVLAAKLDAYTDSDDEPPAALVHQYRQALLGLRRALQAVDLPAVAPDSGGLERLLSAV